MRYNPPPSWPQPPAGWQPPPGWAPDPSWGPPPPGWQVFLPDDAPAPGSTAVFPAPSDPAASPYGTSGSPYGAPTPGSSPYGYAQGTGGSPYGSPPGGSGGSRGVVIGLAALAVVVVVVGGLLFFVTRGDDSTSTASTTTAATSTSAAPTTTSRTTTTRTTTPRSSSPTATGAPAGADTLAGAFPMISGGTEQCAPLAVDPVELQTGSFTPQGAVRCSYRGSAVDGAVYLQMATAAEADAFSARSLPGVLTRSWTKGGATVGNETDHTSPTGVSVQELYFTGSRYVAVVRAGPGTDVEQVFQWTASAARTADQMPG